MRKLHMLAATNVIGLGLALTITGTTLAWHPQGKITKTVQDITSKSIVSDVSDANNAITVSPGDTLKYTVTVSNIAQPAANNDNDMAFTELADNLPSGVELISNPGERQITEDLGTITPGNNIIRQYDVKVTSQTSGDILTNEACFTGDSIVKDNPQQGCAKVVVRVSVPSYSCDLLSIIAGDNHSVTINKFQESSKNADFSNVVIDWGDNTATLTTANPVDQTHQYGSDGTYRITATAHFTVNKEDKVASGDKCVTSVSFTTPAPPASPTQLPNTGTGSFILPVALTSIAGYAVYLFHLRYRRAHQ